jgi:two-component system, response regulator PdtaR
MPLCVLIAEDDTLIADLLSAAVEEAGGTVIGIADSAETALSLARDRHPDLALLDIQLTGMGDGISIGHTLRDSYGTLLVFVSGSGDPETRKRIDALSPFAFLQKPFRVQQVAALVEKAQRGRS